jgi:hypothetical protein
MTSICSVTFSDDWVVRLRALHAQATYAGHLEGPLTSWKNDGVIGRMLEKADMLFSNGATPVHLVPPIRTVGRTVDGYEPAGEPVPRESLPPVWCIGDFEADVVPGADGCASCLIVVWFQEAPPPVPIEPDLVALIANIPWSDLAASYWC